MRSRSCARALTGLSPRVRGNPAVREARHPVRRSIPARAGEPRTAPCRGPVRRVYPRACGGTFEFLAREFGENGLSPRVRGNLLPHLRPGPHRGSIPARAGEPTSRPRSGSYRRVYPRACGGTVSVDPDLPEIYGLSPRVRGNRFVDTGAGTPYGSIPARAGEPDGLVVKRLGVQVYPRACGGTCAPYGRPEQLLGLSPRVRGNQAEDPATPSSERSIPARAGEPLR